MKKTYEVKKAAWVNTIFDEDEMPVLNITDRVGEHEIRLQNGGYIKTARLGKHLLVYIDADDPEQAMQAQMTDGIFENLHGLTYTEIVEADI